MQVAGALNQRRGISRRWIASNTNVGQGPGARRDFSRCRFVVYLIFAGLTPHRVLIEAVGLHRRLWHAASLCAAIKRHLDLPPCHCRHAPNAPPCGSGGPPPLCTTGGWPTAQLKHRSSYNVAVTASYSFLTAVKAADAELLTLWHISNRTITRGWTHRSHASDATPHDLLTIRPSPPAAVAAAVCPIQ